MHGGKCIPDGFNEKGKLKFYCDCSVARNEHGEPFAGEYCQFVATEYCSKETPNVDSFCTNGGSCLSLIQPDQV